MVETKFISTLPVHGIFLEIPDCFFLLCQVYVLINPIFYYTRSILQSRLLLVLVYSVYDFAGHIVSASLLVVVLRLTFHRFQKEKKKTLYGPISEW